ncbi:DUF4198 domain-containing protein [Phycobacter sp. K97]|uniref:DUF4198 domain-containing protein n=1 Tax=Phycobacter sedimenti TaxID=3133977 RepID=UPI00311E8F5D
MKNRLLSFVLIANGLAGSIPAFAHEFWIEPKSYQVSAGEPVTADLVNGQSFKGARLPYFEKRTKRFEVISGAQRLEYQGRMGDLPALSLRAAEPGLLTVVHETEPETLNYKDWEKFDAFAQHKGFADIRERHGERGLPFEDFTERYSRHAKALIAVGSGAGTDSLRGLETEFVAEANPYTLEADTLPVRIYYQGEPRAGAQIEVFERTPTGEVTVFLLRSDTGGRAEIPVKPGHSYLLDAVVLRPADADSGAVWETLWAALTFAVP